MKLRTQNPQAQSPKPKVQRPKERRLLPSAFRLLHSAFRLLPSSSLAVLLCAALPAWAESGIVSNVKVLSDKVEDVSSPEAWKAAYIKDGMSDQDKCVAIWKTIVKYRHQGPPPQEYLQGEQNVHDPLKTINVYGYGMCCCASADIEALARYAGFIARGRIIRQHSVPEIWYDNAWHLFDASLMSYFFNKDGKVASVDEIRDSILAWHKDNPGYRFADNKLREFGKNGGWKKGPAVLATCDTYDQDGINSAGWHGWWSNVSEYDYKVEGAKFAGPDGKTTTNVYDYGGIMGYKVNVQLREGEKLTRNWFNKGLHINMDLGKEGLDILKDRKNLSLQRKLGDLAPGRVGNGTLEYNVPMADGKFRLGALTADNLDAKTVRVADAAKSGVLVIRMPSSYVYLGGELSFKPVLGEGGSIAVSFSDNNGLDWKPLAKVDKAEDQKIDLKKYVYRRYDYRVKFEMSGKGAGLDALRFAHDIQHSQAPLPIIISGDNKITFTAGPQEGTITFEGNMDPEAVANGKQLAYTDFHPTLAGMDKKCLRIGDTGTGEAIFPVATPGDITRIRMSLHWRCRDPKDSFDVSASFDGGKTWKSVQKLGQGQPANGAYFTFSDVPAGSKAAQIRIAGTQRNTCCVFDQRMDVDYKEPNGGFRPVLVTYVWEEDGQEKKDEHVCRTPEDSWTIKCGPKTVAKSYSVELAK